MKNILKALTITLILLIGVEIKAQPYDSTIYEVGSAAGIPFDTDWSFYFDTQLHFAGIENDSNIQVFTINWFNDGNPFIATCTRHIPEMADFDDVEISLNFTELMEPEDSVFLYTSSDFITWNLLGKWGALNEMLSASRDFSTNGDAEYVKLEITGTVPSGGGIYKFSDFVVKVESVLNIGIEDNIIYDQTVYSYDDNIVIRSTSYDEYAVILYNLNGKEVYSKSFNGSTEIELSIPVGVYFVNVTSKKGTFNKKVVLK